MVKTLGIISFAIIFLIPAHGAWNWELSKFRYKKLPVFERNQLQKASGLFAKKNYLAAASEFEKFKVQFEDSEIISYVTFMRGYSLLHAKDRFAAIKVYNQVLDYFGDEIADAAPSLYFLGEAHRQNGDIRKSLEAMQEMAEDEDYSKHPLAAGALNQLAHNHMKNQQEEAAVKMWKQVVATFVKSHEGQAEQARKLVIGIHVKNTNYAELETWLLSEKDTDDAYRLEMVKSIWEVANKDFHSAHGNYSNLKKADKQKSLNAFWEYFTSQKHLFVKDQQEWNFYIRCVTFLTRNYLVKKELARVMGEVLPLLTKVTNDKLHDKYVETMADSLSEANLSGDALRLLDHMKDRSLGLYKKYEVHLRAKKFDRCLQTLEDLETTTSDKLYKIKALEAKAFVYHKKTFQYDKAIKVYEKLDNPPTNLWGIQDCHYRKGRLKDALKVLTEIQNAFPKETPRVLWTKASYHHKSGQAKLAIKYCRHVMLAYKKNSYSSYAHQLLENYGIQSGGGVIEE